MSPHGIKLGVCRDEKKIYQTSRLTVRAVGLEAEPLTAGACLLLLGPPKAADAVSPVLLFLPQLLPNFLTPVALKEVQGPPNGTLQQAGLWGEPPLIE